MQAHTQVQESKSSPHRLRGVWSQVKSNILTQDQAHEATSRITTSVTFEPFRLADFVIEAVTEDEAVKHAVFKKLDQASIQCFAGPIKSISLCIFSKNKRKKATGCQGLLVLLS